MKIEQFEDIEAWQEGRVLTGGVYDAIDESPEFLKDWGLKDQITRASGSVMNGAKLSPETLIPTPAFGHPSGGGDSLQRLLSEQIPLHRRGARSAGWVFLKFVNLAPFGSVMHNIAEGFDSGSTKEFIRFLGYSQRSCSEVQSQLYVALDRKYISKSQFVALYSQAKVSKAKVGGFIRYLKKI